LRERSVEKGREVVCDRFGWPARDHAAGAGRMRVLVRRCWDRRRQDSVRKRLQRVDEIRTTGRAVGMEHLRAEMHGHRLRPRMQ
jgi:hypothetical protein